MKIKRDIILSGVVIKYPSIYEVNKEGIYSAAFLIKKDDKVNLDRIKNAFNDIFNEGYKGKKIKTPLEDGDQKSWEGYENHYYVNSSNYKVEPKLVGSDSETNLRNSKEEDIQGNDTVNVKLSFWTDTESKYSARINAGLMGVQFVKQGERYVPPEESLGFESVPGSAPKPKNGEYYIDQTDIDDIFGE